MNMQRWFCLVVFSLIGFFATLSAEDTFLDPDKAGSDYAVQGEYIGELSTEDGDEKWGAQIVALGGSHFDLVGYKGGLPGDGWKRGDEVYRSRGAAKNGIATFAGDEFTITVNNGVLSVSTDGNEIGKLKRVVRKSPTLGAKPPEGAKVLFDGSNADAFENGQVTEGNLLAANCWSKDKFGDHTLHIEFRTPFKPQARGQARGNSGVYAQSRYEIQVLDSFGLEGKDNECGGIYSISQPIVNMCFPPLTWQTYDIDFTAARFEMDKKSKNARITVKHNGVVIHDDLELPHKTPGRHDEGPDPDAVYLQGHGNPVVFRNIWVIEK